MPCYLANTRFHSTTIKGRCVHPPSTYFISPIHLTKEDDSYGKGDAKHTLLSLPETRKWREEFLSKKWLGIKQEVDYKGILRTVN